MLCNLHTTPPRRSLLSLLIVKKTEVEKLAQSYTSQWVGASGLNPSLNSKCIWYCHSWIRWSPAWGSRVVTVQWRGGTQRQRSTSDECSEIRLEFWAWGSGGCSLYLGGSERDQRGLPKDLDNRYTFTSQIKKEQSPGHGYQLVQMCADIRKCGTFSFSLKLLAVGFCSCSAQSLTFNQ